MLHEQSYSFSNVLDYPVSWVDMSTVKKEKDCSVCQKNIVESSADILVSIL